MTTTIARPLRKRKRRALFPVDPHGFESVGSILRGMRAKTEARMTPAFDPPLSLRLDFLLDLEQQDAEADDERA